MDCRRFEDRMDAYEAGTLSSEEQAAAEKHIRECSACRSLREIVSGKADPLVPESRDDLTRAILGRTSGTACAGVEPLLCEWIDRNLGETEQEMLQLHVAHCVNCGALAATLTELATVLPEMAALDPGPRFTVDVLAATRPLRSSTRTARRRDHVWEWWSRLIRRPRFAWEAAYVGTLIVLLALGNPAVLLESLPRSFVAPQTLVRGGDQVLEQATTALAVGQAFATQSFSGLRIESRTYLGSAVDFTNRTARALRQRAATWLDELSHGPSEPAVTGEPKRDLH